LVLGVRLLVLGTLGGLIAGNGLCLLGCQHPADATLAALHDGQPREEALAALDPFCSHVSNTPSGDMLFQCAPRAPRICACAPAPMRQVTFGVGAGDRIERVTKSTVLGAMRGPR
jgi:hypothetical protein